MFERYHFLHILLRRLVVVCFGLLAFPFAIWRSDRAKVFSLCRRAWMKTSDAPVWLQQHRN